MKLLTPQETNIQKQSEQARDVFRINQIQETLKKEISQLNQIEASFNRNMNLQRKQWAEEEATHLKRIIELEEKIKEYEIKEKSFFFPIDALQKKTHDNYERSKIALTEANQKKEECDELEEFLHTKLDEVSDRSQELDDREEKIKIHEQGIKDQQLHATQLSQTLAQEWQKFYEEKNIFKIDSEKELKIIELARKDIAKRESELLEEKETVRQEKIRLLDGRQTLARAWKELEQKNNK